MAATADGNDDRPAGEPVLRVIRGDATSREIAALIAVLMSSRSGDDEAAPPAARPAWADRSAMLHRPVQPGPGAWRRSGFPS